jgi:nucleolar protein 12
LWSKQIEPLQCLQLQEPAMSLFGNLFGGAGEPRSSLFSPNSKYAAAPQPAATQAAEPAPKRQADGKNGGAGGEPGAAKKKKRKAPAEQATHASDAAAKDADDSTKQHKKQRKDKQRVPESTDTQQQARRAAAAAAAAVAAVNPAAALQVEAKPAGKRLPAAAPAIAPAEEDDRLSRTVFVGNLPGDVKRKALAKAFSGCGQVESVRLRSLPLKRELGSKVPRRGAIAQGAIDSEHSAHA